MTPERWKQIDKLVQAAMSIAPSERAAFVSEACTGDCDLQREVESLVAYQEQAASFMEIPALEAAASLADDEDQAIVGQVFAHYKILDLLGAGGMGTVYLAQDTSLRRKVALKLLPGHVTEDKDRLRRFEQEARAASALNHPNILTIYEVGRTDGKHFIATEFIDGVTLRQRLTGARMELDEILETAAQVASALVAAHEAGIVHRDIKPENIMLRRDRIVKVLDFGLVKLTENSNAREVVASELPTRAMFHTETGVVMGTTRYMSPEQMRGVEVDARTDIWSLGCVLYEMVSGRAPFQGETNSDVIAAVLEREPMPLARYAGEAPVELEWILKKALRKDREERYQTARELLSDLKNLKQRLQFEAELKRSAAPELKGAATTGGVQTALQTAQGSTPRSVLSAESIIAEIKRHKHGVTLTLAVLILVAALAGFFYFNRARALTEKDTILLADLINTTGEPVFDGALKQALAIQLEQSPFLNIFSEERVRETLRLMGRSPDDRVTKDVAREICQRQGLKAYLSGSISNLGSHLVITLEAVNANTGDTLARQQVEAESKEEVLSTLGRAATKLREKLGESLASIQKYDAPFEHATTSSLEALKAYSLGREQVYKGNPLESIPFYKRAIELDLNFARAYDALAHSYNNSGKRQLAREAAQKAFELRDRTSEYEKLKIASSYYWLVTGEMEKAIEGLEMLTRTYPRDYIARINLISRYDALGQYERVVEEAREAIRLNPSSVFGYWNLAVAFRSLNRFDEAKEIYEQALAQKVDTTGYHFDLYRIAFVRGDTAAMQQQLDWARGKPDEYVTLLWQSNIAAYHGQLRRARELSQLGTDALLSRNLKENAAESVSADAFRAAAMGNCRQAREDLSRASALPSTDFSFSRFGMALALCGEFGEAESFAEEYAKQFPKHTLVNAVWLPAIRAAIELRRNHPAQAIQYLQSAHRYDRVGVYWPEYLRGQAYLAQGAGGEAAAEFQKILDRRGLAPVSVLYPLARLGLARAATLTGDIAKSRKAYEDFLAVWNDADPDIPVLQEAKREYAKLK